MKNVGAKLKLWLCVLSVLICALFAATKVTSFPVLFADSVANQPVVLELTGLSDYSNAVLNLTERYPAADNALVFFDKNDDLVLNSDGNYLVSAETFTELTGIQASGLLNYSASIPLYNLEDLALQNGYDVTESDCSMVLSRPFGNRRLIIYADNPNLDLYGAVEALIYQDMHIHQYESELATSLAYHYYLTCEDVCGMTPDNFCWVESETAGTPNLVDIDTDSDLDYYSWGAEFMGVPRYAQYLRDLVKAENNNISGLPEVVVAVMDTGIDTDHPWFTDRLLHDANGIVGIDSTGKSLGFEDDDGHGTHCAGIICDLTLPNVKILPVKFFYKDNQGKTIGDTLGASAGLSQIIEMKQNGLYNIVAVNMSFTNPVDTSNVIIEAATRAFGYLDEAKEQGIFCIAAAGNHKDDEETDAYYYSPAWSPKTVTVTALTHFGNQLSFDISYSNHGHQNGDGKIDSINVCAPGTNIQSARMGNETETINMSGTSMATPHVAAFVALLKSDPSHDYSDDEITQILFNGTKTDFLLDLGDEGKDIYYGYGMPVLTAAVPETTYMVKHYKEPVYNLNAAAPERSQYILAESETLHGDYGTETQAVAKTYTGFTADDFEQEIIQVDGSTVIKIYYKRNAYDLTIHQSGRGITGITGAGRYLYGANVELTPTLQTGYEWYLWQLEECNNANFAQSFNLHSMTQSFTMPATNLELTAYAQPVICLISVKVAGKGLVTPNIVSVNYGEGVIFEIRPNEEYKLESVYLDDVKLEVTEAVSDQIYSVTLSSITANAELKVNFVEISPKKDWTNLAIWIGGGAVATILFGSSGTMLIIAFSGRKKFVLSMKNEVQNLEKPVITPENQLLAALEFVNGREVDFMKFCRENCIDYKHDYSQAALKFYEHEQK